jgi:hypothetical protein
MSKVKVDGIIMVLTCQKYIHTRLVKCRLPKDEYELSGGRRWKVIYTLGDLALKDDEDDKAESWTLVGNLLTVKCEDSYIHLLKKCSLAIKALYEIFDISEGILRSGDDLVYNQDALEQFLSMSNKPDYYGQSPAGRSFHSNDINFLTETVTDPFMYNYYLTHSSDFEDPCHNLKGVDISKFMKRPRIDVGAAGVLYYLSNVACSIVIFHMEMINYDVFAYDTFSKSYPYTIEDCGMSFIMYLNCVPFVHCSNMYRDSPGSGCIAYHTNMGK